MAKLPYKIDSVDFTDFIHKYGYAVRYERVHGENDFVYLNGNEDEDLLQLKPIVTVTLNDTPSAQLRTFLNAVLKASVRLTYFDPAYGEITRTAIPTVERVDVLLEDCGEHWYSGFDVIMRVNLNE